MQFAVQAYFDTVTGTWSYLVDDGAGQCAVIDPVMGFDPRTGRTDASPVEAIALAIEARGLTVKWLLETHAHADHLSGSPWLQHRVGGRLAIGSGIRAVQSEFRGVFNAEDLAVDGSQFDRLFKDGEEFWIGGLRATALHVPGHTPADVAYRVVDPAGGPDAVFVGDTLFHPDLGTARCDFPGGDAATLYRSTRRLLDLPPETLVYICHDYPPAGRAAACRSTVAAQRAGNVHVGDGIDAATFVDKRTRRDATLPLPALLLPAVQVNVRAGRLPPVEGNGTAYLKIPVDRL